MAGENVTVVKKIRDYSKYPEFKKKSQVAIAFLEEHLLAKLASKKSESIPVNMVYHIALLLMCFFMGEAVF